jgi:hypothetical protein
MSTEELSQAEPIARRRRVRRNYWPARLRVLRVLSKLVLVGLFLVVFAVGICRVTRMIGLPDVGEPFEPEEPVARSRPDADPLIVYAQAADQIVTVVGLDPRWNPRSNPLSLTWADASPPLQLWVTTNAGALALFRRGTELRTVQRSDGSPTARLPALDRGQNTLIWLALLEGDRLKDAGDVKEAWGWYLAALRSTYHRTQGNEPYERMVAQRLRSPIVDRMDTWAEDPNVTPGLLRGALDDVLACRVLMPSDLDTLEKGYTLVMLELDGGHWSQYIPRDRGARESWRVPLSFLMWQAGRFLDNEPERSRRVARLAFANWRAWLERPDGRRPRPAVKLLIHDSFWTQRVDFFEPAPDAPAAARRMSAARLASWADTCRDARFPLSSFWSMFQSTRAAEQQSYRNIVVQLAEQLHLRERGTMPPSLDALVGPYLQSIPLDGTSEIDDGTAPIVGR